MILVSISVMSALSFPYRVGTPRAFINMASLYFIYAAMTQRVSFIYLALFVSSLLIDKISSSKTQVRTSVGSERFAPFR